VSASFLLEQVGLPVLSVGMEKVAKDRFELIQSMVRAVAL
jgi:hypothetical protein